MALEKIYTPIGWQNKPSTATPLGSHNLSKMDEALDEIDTRLVELSGDTELLDGKVEEAKADITQNAGDITSLNNSFTGFSTVVSQGMQQLFDRVDEAEDKIENNTEDINALKIVPTASGSQVYIFDASNMRLEGIDFFGESKQMQTTGKNLYAEYKVGTSNAIHMNHLGVVGQLEPDTVYYIAFKGTVGNKYVANAEVFNGTIEYPLNTLTVKEGVNVIVAKTGSEVPTTTSVSILKNKAYNSDPNFSDVMIMKVNEPEPYEPYTGRLPSPNPDYPQPIESKIVEKVIVSGKNFFGFGESAIDKTTELRPLAYQRLIFTKIDDNTIKCNHTGGTYSTGYVEIEGIDGTKDYAFSFIVEHNTLGFTPRIEKYASRCTTTRLSLMIYAGNGATEVASSEYIILKNIQVELGTTVTSFEQFKGIQTVNLSAPIELNGIGGVRDTDKEKKFGVVVFDGSDDEGWSKSNTLNGRYILPMSDAKEYAELLCTHATRDIVNDNLINTCAINAVKYFYINTSFSTLAEWKSHLQSNPMTVVYELAEPIETSLPQADIDAIKNLHTYKPNTVVMNDADAEMEVQYVADTKTYIDRKFEALASAIVNQ